MLSQANDSAIVFPLHYFGSASHPLGLHKRKTAISRMQQAALFSSIHVFFYYGQKIKREYIFLKIGLGISAIIDR